MGLIKPAKKAPAPKASNNPFESFEAHPEVSLTKDGLDSAVHRTVYRANYEGLFKAIARGELDMRSTFRALIQQDLFFIVHFVMGIPRANHPFVVERCFEVESGLQTGTVDIWAREHFKSTCITIGLTVKRIVNNPECTTAIFSFKKPAAEKFLDAVRKVLESPLMVWCFPEILYEKPTTESPSWSLQNGIRVKRSTTSRKEHTVEAFGLVEGMPTGGHFDHRIYDDVETDDLARNPEQLQVCFEKFEMSRNLGSDGGTEQIIGTYYSHCGVLVKLGNKKDIHGNKMYKLRTYPATDDGTVTGKPVFFSQEYLDSKKTDSTFNSQQLCNPTPFSTIKLHYDRFRFIDPENLPKDRIKFVIVDPAGDDSVQTGADNDMWAIGCVSVQPCIDDLGMSAVFVEDVIAEKMGLSEAIDAACNLYMRNGRIAVLGVEKVANDTTYRHIQNALRAKGRFLEIKQKGKWGGNLQLLNPSGKSKNYRIESALTWPLNNGMLHLSNSLTNDVQDKIETECNKFPFFHVDILDMLAYVYDILTDPTFSFLPAEEEKEEADDYDDYQLGRNKSTGY